MNGKVQLFFQMHVETATELTSIPFNFHDIKRVRIRYLLTFSDVRRSVRYVVLV